ncbi:hypothetical protein KY326_00785 [Candidatus Woesearchaeota archaeon]|nr:hypothetical protein [Candidatus Woesearchaeota archaeon]
MKTFGNMLDEEKPEVIVFDNRPDLQELYYRFCRPGIKVRHKKDGKPIDDFMKKSLAEVNKRGIQHIDFGKDDYHRSNLIHYDQYFDIVRLLFHLTENKLAVVTRDMPRTRRHHRLQLLSEDERHRSDFSELRYLDEVFAKLRWTPYRNPWFVSQWVLVPSEDYGWLEKDLLRREGKKHKKAPELREGFEKRLLVI